MRDWNEIIERKKANIRYKDKEMYKNLEEKRKRYFKYKYGVIFIFLVILLCVVGLEYSQEGDVFAKRDNIFQFSMWFLLGWVLYAVIVILIRKFLYNRVILKAERKKGECNNSLNFLRLYIFQQRLKSLYLIISPDYFWAKYFKRKIINKEKETIELNDSKYIYCGKEKISLYSWDRIKIKNKYLIIFSNWGNLIISTLLMIFFLIILICKYTDGNHSVLLLLSKEPIKSTMISIFFARLVSRTIEICIAFYKDITESNDKVFIIDYSKKSQNLLFIGKLMRKKLKMIYVHKWKDSYLLKGDRLSLAFHSILEITILYQIAYVLLSSSNTYLEQLLSTLQFSLMNGSYDKNSNVLLSLLETSQTITILTLVILSIASYLGADDDITKREKDLYLFLQDERK